MYVSCSYIPGMQLKEVILNFCKNYTNNSKTKLDNCNSHSLQLFYVNLYVVLLRIFYSPLKSNKEFNTVFFPAIILHILYLISTFRARLLLIIASSSCR